MLRTTLLMLALMLSSSCWAATGSVATTILSVTVDTVWNRYGWILLVVLLVLIALLWVLWSRNALQLKKIDSLSRDAFFINRMPVPYAKVKLLHDKEGKLTDVEYTLMNDAFKRLITDNSVPGNSFLLFPTDFFADKLSKILQGAKEVVFEYNFPHTNTHYEFRLCLVNSSKTKTRDIKSQLYVFANDITHRYNIQQRLRNNAHKLDMSLDVAKEIAWQIELSKMVVVFNTYVKYGRKYPKRSNDPYETDSELPFEDYMKLVYPDDQQMLRDTMSDLAHGAISRFKVQYRTWVGYETKEIEWIENCGEITGRDDNGRPTIVTGVMQVITERKKQEQIMTTALEKANESERLKSAFLANMSHEIRTPLNAIVGFSNLIVETNDIEKRRKFAEIISKNNNILLNLVNDVLDLAKIESNIIQLTVEPVDVNEVIDQVEQIMRMRIPAGVMFNAIKYLPECVVEADSTRLTQVLINLISNSCKFTQNGAITFGYELDGDADEWLRFFVKDTGIGVAQEHQDKIFDRFFKIDNFVPGTGLGLAICRSLVEKMNGEIGMTSPGLGKGSTFWFRIPNKSVVESKVVTPSRPAYFSTERKEMPMTGKTMLVAEDNDSNYLLVEALAENRFKLIRAKNGQEAVEKYRKYEPDIILMDINMPVMNGYEAVEKIRKLSADVPIIAVTAYAFASDKNKVLSSGFDAYISKPITDKALNDAIEKLL